MIVNGSPSTLDDIYAMGRSFSSSSFWNKTPRTPSFEASHWMKNRLLKLGLIKTGASISAVFSCAKAVSASSSKLNCFIRFLVRQACNGDATVELSWMNLPYHPAIPRNLLSCFGDLGIGKPRTAAILSSSLIGPALNIVLLVSIWTYVLRNFPSTPADHLNRRKLFLGVVQGWLYP